MYRLLVLRLVVQEDTDATFGGAVSKPGLIICRILALNARADGVLQAIVISILDKTFEGIAVALNNFENHRYRTAALTQTGLTERFCIAERPHSTRTD